MKRLLASTQKCILLCSLIGLMTTQSLSASDLHTRQLVESLQKINIPYDNILVIQMYTGLWLDERTKEGKKLLEESEELIKKGNELQEKASMRLVRENEGNKKNDVQNRLKYAINVAKGSTMKGNGKDKFRKGIRIRLEVLYFMEILNRDHSSKTIWSNIKKVDPTGWNLPSENSGVTYKKYQKMIEQTSEHLPIENNWVTYEAYKKTIEKACKKLAIKYKALMEGRRVGDLHPWECLENAVDFLFAPSNTSHLL